MATANAAATLKRAQDLSTDLAGAVLEIREGTTVLASHTITTFTATNSGDDGVATASGMPNTATIDTTGTADNAQLVKDSKVYSLSLADITLSTTTFISGETSTLNSLVINLPNG